MKRIYLVSLLIFIAIGCGSKKKVSHKSNENKKSTTTTVYKEKKHIAKKKKSVKPKRKRRKSYNEATLEYIATYKEYAMEGMRVYKIPASIILAQGILESGSGNSELTQKSNNHFGIKCHRSWGGGKVYHDDDEEGECFRKYRNPAKSFRDHSLFLSGRKRYAKLFQLKIDDYVGWAKGLKKAGYATDRRYPAKLIGLIERFELYQYDDEVLGKQKSSKKRKKSSTYKAENIKYHIVKKGDTLYNISKRYGISVEKLKSDNNLIYNTIYLGQMLRIK